MNIDTEKFTIIISEHGEPDIIAKRISERGATKTAKQMLEYPCHSYVEVRNPNGDTIFGEKGLAYDPAKL
ncbi:MAG: hypothetical protein JXQ99_14780 [Hyphomicrobiaceae bacterium]